MKDDLKYHHVFFHNSNVHDHDQDVHDHDHEDVHDHDLEDVHDHAQHQALVGVLAGGGESQQGLLGTPGQ